MVGGEQLEASTVPVDGDTCVCWGGGVGVAGDARKEGKESR